MKKKTLVSLLILLMISLFIPNVNAADFTCAALGDDILIDTQLADIVHIIVLVIQIAVPILLVVFGMMDLMKGIMAQKDDEIKKGQQTFIKRLIAAAIVFFVIAIVKLVISAVAGNSDGIMACANCFLEGSGSESCATVTPTPTPGEGGEIVD